MANRINGITVEIGGDTTKLSKALLETGEHIMGGGLVAELVAEETRRRQSDTVPNGYIRR